MHLRRNYFRIHVVQTTRVGASLNSKEVHVWQQIRVEIKGNRRKGVFYFHIQQAFAVQKNHIGIRGGYFHACGQSDSSLYIAVILTSSTS